MVDALTANSSIGSTNRTVSRITKRPSSDPLVCISWNVQTKSLDAFKKNPNAANLIVSELRSQVRNAKRAHPGAAKTPGLPPFIANLSEIKGPPDKVEKIAQLLVAKFQTSYRAKIGYKVTSAGGRSGTRESLITLHSRAIDVQTQMIDTTPQLIALQQGELDKAGDTFDKIRKSPRANTSKYSTTARGPAGLIMDPKEPDFYRKPVAVTATYKGTTIETLSYHAAGPSHTQRRPGPVNDVFKVAQSRKTAVVSGDFNLRGSINSSGYIDIGAGSTSGTTQTKSKASLSTSRLDRTYTSPEAAQKYEFIPIEPKLTESAKVSDHVPITTVLGKRRKEDDQSQDTFGNKVQKKAVKTLKSKVKAQLRTSEPSANPLESGAQPAETSVFDAAPMAQPSQAGPALDNASSSEGMVSTLDTTATTPSSTSSSEDALTDSTEEVAQVITDTESLDLAELLTLLV